MMLAFTDGSNTNWSTLDQDSQAMDNDTLGHVDWHQRTFDLSAHVGKTIDSVSFLSEGYTQPGYWAIVYADVELISADATIHPVYNGESSIALGQWSPGGVTGMWSGIRHLSNVGYYWPSTTTYYHADQLDSARMMTSTGGWPVSASTYLPFGWEWNGAVTSTNHYKFTGKERDTETNNDYFGARYYNASMGRWLSPDWSAAPAPVPYADLSDPQSLNLYGYVRNRPTFKADKDGHCAWDLCIGEATLYVAAAATVAVATWLETPQGKQSAQAAIQSVGILGGKLIDGARSLGDKLNNVVHSETRPGTLGKPDHQQTVQEEAAKGKDGRIEVTIQTPNGMKGSRRADVVRTNPETGATEIVQVYRPTPAGNIPKREQQAAADIEQATGIKPTMAGGPLIAIPDSGWPIHFAAVGEMCGITRTSFHFD